MSQAVQAEKIATIFVHLGERQFDLKKRAIDGRLSEKDFTIMKVSTCVIGFYNDEILKQTEFKLTEKDGGNFIL